MTNLAIDENRLDSRRRRLIFRAWHRGIREIDLILGQYVDAHIAKMSDQTVSELEYIMSFEDRDLLGWITREVSIPAEVDSALFRDIINYCSRINFN
ncbi:succinate dehydrogenase assembly factor 2 [Bartonella sp. 1-1C]|uniref:FAD assembly factor SdhE n=1 Tax=Bartonella sp. 1-1C TaxID=515256 RepID=UPI0001F4C847|nr:succinate dehydrogenase assembly factor 2 [Bartonella sp. 1-1C]ATO57374.1 antitoxin CptB [Bartonella sp. 1-1C]CBI80887.1 conserved hypothetical protein [Bartonella sp. 1-1C]